MKACETSSPTGIKGKQGQRSLCEWTPEVYKHYEAEGQAKMNEYTKTRIIQNKPKTNKDSKDTIIRIRTENPKTHKTNKIPH